MFVRNAHHKAFCFVPLIQDGLRCTQSPGDVMFVPAMWGHAVINLEESVGFASEFIYGASEFSL